jgi:hypothetical protein
MLIKARGTFKGVSDTEIVLHLFPLNNCKRKFFGLLLHCAIAESQYHTNIALSNYGIMSTGEPSVLAMF